MPDRFDLVPEPFDRPLTKAERRTARDYFDRGIEALYEVGMDPAEIVGFLGRQSVKDEIDRFTHEFDDRKQTMERIRHRVRLDLSRLAPLAVGVLQQALVGRFNKEDENGETQVVDPPDKTQVEAAKEVLHNLGISEKIQDVGDAEMNVFVDNRQVNFGPEVSSATSSAATHRERLRSFVDGIIAQAGDVIQKKSELVDVKDSSPAKKRKKKKKRKKR